MTDVYAYWRHCLKAVEKGPQSDSTSLHGYLLPTMYRAVEGAVFQSIENPQPGLWKINVGGGYRDGVKQPKQFVPMQIWLQDAAGVVVHQWGDGLVIGGTIDQEPATADQIERRWLGAAALSKADREFYVANGRWPEDPPEPVSSARDVIELETVETTTVHIGSAPPQAKGSVPGDNAGDLSAFRRMSEQIKGEIAEAQNYFARNPIKTKADADKCENWRQRIYKLGKEADALRIAEKRPHDDAAAAVQALWKPLIDDATKGAKALEVTADTWAKAEEGRLRKIAEDQARARLEADRKAQAEAREKAAKERAEQEAQIARIAADNPTIADELPELPELPPEPEPVPDVIVVDTPKIMLGTTGNRRSAKATPATAAIVDLKAAAAFYAEQKHPDMIALIQKLADKAAKARSSVPGIAMSWEKQEAAE